VNTPSTSSTGAHQHTFSGTTAASGTGNTGAAGSGAAHSNMQPYKAVHFIIRLY
jgi:microcystin-dependent protein